MKRFYECTFCKKGFDNAQALGGHMNIHRRAKAKSKSKAKQGSSPSSVSTTSQEYVNPNCGRAIQGDTYQMHDFTPQYGTEMMVPLHQPLSSFEGLWGSNSSSPTSDHFQEANTRQSVSNDEEVDLELRLGYNRWN